ncbi:MAG: AAA family ATPase [Oscillatoria sp. SIO1A7]|nr:AAA family ATPase [Oscillatoria sp. SIO1A7]
MAVLVGYEDLIQIHDSDNSQVYRARRISDNKPVILKFLNREYPTSEQIRRYKQEYYLTSQLESPGIVKAYGLREWQRSFAIVLEDFGAMSLKQWLKERSVLSLPEFLFLAIAITESLGQIHAHNIIHKDINPANILLNPETKELKIIDFGISSQLSRENPTLKNPNVLEGTLAYVSPEQTGRMNRSLDYRTDFYSLGVTFYELLTGQLPFTAEDALELVHCHIAKMPTLAVSFQQSAFSSQLSDNSQKIPQVLADIVMKLMAKNAEERYQSAEGLQADLEECRRQLEAIGKISSFPLGKGDISDRFQIPQKLYGREGEIASLLEAFERVAETGKVELMLVAGYSGIGKSSLVQELYKPITARRGYFIVGKFDQFQRNIPYSAIVAAFGGLVGQLLGETEAGLQVWREKILKALGNNGQVIIDVIPEVELIIGKQPSVPELGANEAQNRFNLVFGNFIDVFCDKEHPLTLFIDDLQWADLGTLQLLERLLLEGQTEYLLLLGAYRDNEVSAGHPLAMSLARLRQNKGEAIAQVTLNPLPLDRIAALIGDTLQQNPQAADLARLVLQKTGGNPFFVNEFLQALYEEDLLQFDRQARSWQWDMGAIAARDFTDNVVELMVKKLQKLPPSSQETLSIAACWGAEFDLEILSWVGEKSPRETFELIKIALDSGFILPLSELDENLLIQSYKFGHDRIQQAAYALIPGDKKESLHYRIGRILLQNLPPEAREERIFELVGQLNYGTALISDRQERDELAALNLTACRKAKEATAYQAGREYASTGLSWLGENAWARQYEMTLALQETSTELAAACADFEAMEGFAETVIEKAGSLLEKIYVYRIVIVSNISRGQPKEAIAIARSLLQDLGIDLATTPTENDIQEAIAEIEDLIGDRDIENLARLPIMTDGKQIAILQIINSMIQAAYISGSSLLYFLLVAWSVKISIQYGNTSVSASAYSHYSMITCNRLQNVDRGVRFASLALQLVSQLDAKAFKPEVLHVAGEFIIHRKYHLKETLPPIQEDHAAALETGNMQYVGYSASLFCFNSFWCGQPLANLEQETLSYYQKLMQLNLTIENYFQIYFQTILKLREVADSQSILSVKAIDEEELLSLLISASDALGLHIFHLDKLMLRYLFGEIDSARDEAVEVRRYLMVGIGMVSIPAFYFYDSLAALAKGTELAQRYEILEQVENNQAELQEQWARHAPMNHQHKVDLVEAEKCRFLGQKAEAIEFYNKAISGAKENEYIQEEALANELTAKFYLDWGQETAARAYMVEARYCYSRWGATAKVRHLEDNYPQLFRLSAAGSSTNDSPDRSKTIQSTTSNSNSNLDIAALMKASQSIASEIVLRQLLTQLIKVLMENTGAQFGLLILETEGELLIEAEAGANGEIEVLQSMPLEFVKPDGSLPLLCSAIVNYVARTQESVVLNDARNEGNFTAQSYIQNFQVKSILCVPLVEQGQLGGLVYMENNLTTGAFTQERVDIVQLLSGQAAIAISNARLYSQLQESERQIKELYDASKRFVPAEFLSLLDDKSIVDVKLGDRVEREMTVLFSDIRDFTTISEKMTPAENFAFINEYLGYMEPLIQQHGGFIDKYIGDAIMALFPNEADDAVQGAIAMLQELKKYNYYRQERNLKPVRIGIGLHSGRLMLGTVGGSGRMDGTAIGDAVNLSSRVEGLTKTYGVSLLITYKTWHGLSNPLEYELRFIDKVKAKGKSEAVGLFEVFAADPPELREAKIATKTKFEEAVLLYHSHSFEAAASLFEECLSHYEGDRAARIYRDRCQGQFH